MSDEQNSSFNSMKAYYDHIDHTKKEGGVLNTHIIQIGTLDKNA